MKTRELIQMLKEFRPDTEVKLWFPQSVPDPDEDKPCIYTGYEIKSVDKAYIMGPKDEACILAELKPGTTCADCRFMEIMPTGEKHCSNKCLNTFVREFTEENSGVCRLFESKLAGKFVDVDTTEGKKQIDEIKKALADEEMTKMLNELKEKAPDTVSVMGSTKNLCDSCDNNLSNNKCRAYPDAAINMAYGVVACKSYIKRKQYCGACKYCQRVNDPYPGDYPGDNMIAVREYYCNRHCKDIHADFEACDRFTPCEEVADHETQEEPSCMDCVLGNIGIDGKDPDKLMCHCTWYGKSICIRDELGKTYFTDCDEKVTKEQCEKAGFKVLDFITLVDALRYFQYDGGCARCGSQRCPGDTSMLLDHAFCQNFKDYCADKEEEEEDPRAQWSTPNFEGNTVIGKYRFMQAATAYRAKNGKDCIVTDKRHPGCYYQIKSVDKSDYAILKTGDYVDGFWVRNLETNDELFLSRLAATIIAKKNNFPMIGAELTSEDLW